MLVVPILGSVEPEEGTASKSNSSHEGPVPARHAVFRLLDAGSLLRGGTRTKPG